jgi:SAM-dependent methyltransferase
MSSTPAVSTSIGVEGFDLQPDRHVLLADSAGAFANAISTLATKEELWQHLSQEGRAYVIGNHGSDAVFRRFSYALAELMDPLSNVSIFWEEMQATHASGFDGDLNSKVVEQAIRRGKLKGICNVSGRLTEFIASSDNLRESLVSTASSSVNRQRQLICTLSMAVFGHPRATLAQIAVQMNENHLRVYVAESNSVVSNFLRQKLKEDLFVSSEYFGPEYKSGEIVNGILHEDLLGTSFADETFDIIITAEVLEHVPDALRAEKELMRILKPGGLYCFTVPFLPASDHDLILADIDEQGNVRHFAEPQFHGDPLRPEGILVYRLFSFNDMKHRFEAMGHQFKSYRFWSESLGIVGGDCWAHVVTKTGRAMTTALSS